MLKKKQNMLLQTDDKPLECEKTCTYINSQRQRMVNHSGYKPPVCSVRNHSLRLDICKSMKTYILEPQRQRGVQESIPYVLTQCINVTPVSCIVPHERTELTNSIDES